MLNRASCAVCLLLAGLPSAALADASGQLLSDAVTLCDRVVEDPTTAIVVPDGEDSYPFSNSDGSSMSNSVSWDGADGSNWSAGFTRIAMPGGVQARCSLWHAYWDEADHPYDDMEAVIDTASPELLGATATKSGGQSPDMTIRAERLVWTDGAFPPLTVVRMHINTDSVNLYVDRMVPNGI